MKLRGQRAELLYAISARTSPIADSAGPLRRKGEFTIQDLTPSSRKLMPENLCGVFAAPAETESSAKGALTSTESALRLDAVKNLIHNSRFDTLFARGALRSIDTNPNCVRQMLPALIRKGGDIRHSVSISIFEYEPTLQTKRTGKNETNF